MAILVTNAVQVARFANALYGIKLGSTTNAAVNADIANIGLSATVNAYYDYSFGSKTSAEVAAIMLGNLGLTGNTAAAAYVEGQLNAAGSAKGVAVLNMLNAFSNLESDATFGAAATAWNATIVSAQAYTASNTADVAATATTTQTFTLTTGVDNFNGGNGNDNFIADNTQTNKVASVADVLNGGGGTDTLTVYGELATTPQISSIEKVVLDTFADGTTANFAAISGITNLTNIRAAGASTVSVNDGVAVTIAKNALTTKDQTVNFGSTDTSASLTLDTFKTDTAKKLIVNGTKVATLNLATTGAASTVGNLDGTATLTKVVVTGDKDLTVTDALEVTVATVDASAFTGKLSVTTTNNTTTQNDTAVGGTVDLVDVTIKGGSGNDTINIAANAADNEVSVDAGAGDDKVVIKTAVAYAAATATNAGDSIVGGAGTDTLSIDGNVVAADLSGAISGFEVLEFTAAANNTSMAVNKLGISQFRLTGATTDVVLTGVAANATATISDDGADLDATIGTDSTADVLNVVLESTGTTTGSAITATNYETLNVTSTKLSTDAATAANKLAGVTASAATKVTLTGAANLVGGTITAKAAATIDASAYTGDLTATIFGASVKSYLGGSGKDEITLAAGDLKQGNTFAGGAGTDKLSVTAASAQDMGIVGLTGFETLNLTSSATGADTVVGDYRNVTDLATLNLVAGDAADNFTLNRLSGDTTLTFGSAVGNVVTTLNAGTAQKVAFTGNYTVGSLTLDSGATTLTVTSDDADTTADEAGGVFTALSGTSLATVNVLGLDKTNLGTLGTTVTKVDASGAKGALTVTASATATNIIGSQVADAITGGGAADTIQGGKGADVLDGGAGADVFVFEATGANNGADVFSVGGANKLVAGSGGDVLNFKNFLAGGSVDQNGGTGTAITAYLDTATSDVNITNKVVLLAATNGTTDDNVDTAAEVAALIQGAGNVFSLTSGGKAIVVAGDTASDATSATSELLFVYFVDDSLDGVAGTVGAADVVLVGTTTQDFDLDTLITTNFAFA